VRRLLAQRDFDIHRLDAEIAGERAKIALISAFLVASVRPSIRSIVIAV
jgi:hypothetical protein